MGSAVIVDAVRTAAGRRNGALRGWHAVDLAATVLEALVRRNDLDPALVDHVIMGCATQVGEQGLNIGRNAVLAAGLPESVAGTTVDRQCGSSQQAVHFAAHGVAAGAYDAVIAAGVEVMSRVPTGASMQVGGLPFGPRVAERYAPVGGLVPPGIAAELVAERWGLSREDLDAFALRSHQRAARARAERRFDAEIVPVPVRDDAGRDTGRVFDQDEGIRPEVDAGTLAALKPSFKPGGRVTAGNSCQIADGAAAVLITSEEKAGELGLDPRARFASFSLAGGDPVATFTATAPVTETALARAELTIEDMDAIEVHEAFASVVLAWEDELRPDVERVNVNGGAIALGHPPGSSGARLLTTLVCELERAGGRYGLQVMGEAGGMANATVIERLG